MSKFLRKLDKIADKIPEGFGHARAMAIGILNPDRRHDDPEEKRADMVRAEIMAGHRFHSFADQRSQNFVKWHIDGHDYMWAVSELLESAREAIFILDWWLTPELYLRRPPAKYPEWRIDRILKRKAEQGVKVYVIVYKEITQTMSMSSHHTKVRLEALHPNITCMRHPDHIGSKDDVEFWSHHEKVVVVDNRMACIGGLDLCFGRWDTHNHPLADVHPTNPEDTLFPGQDYNNARIMDFANVPNYVSNGLSAIESARMPWHDVHMTLTGTVVLDIVQHFVERWNEVKKRKYRNDERFDWLALPHDVELSPNEAVVRHPHRERWHEIGRSFRDHFHRRRHDDEPADYDGDHPVARGSCRVQAVRSVSDWSHGTLTEQSIQNAYIELITNAEHFIYIENQFFISNTVEDGPVKNLIARALVERIVRAGREGKRFRVVVVIPEVPGFAGQVKDETSVKTIMAAQYRTINRGGHSIYEEVRKAGYEPSDYIRFFHLRAYDRINAPFTSYIHPIEERSGIVFHQLHVALARLWVGDRMNPDDPKDVSVSIPTGKSLVEQSTSGAKPEMKTETYPLPETVEEAQDIVDRWNRAAQEIRSDEDVADNVVQHMLHDRTTLLDEKWLGTEEEERNAYVSELLYIHSKVMIVDDRRVIMGSANLNDRSQKGDGDSEIALVVEDEDMIESTMNGEPYQVGRFAASLRRKLYREHLGLIPPQDCDNQPDSFQRPAPHPNADETEQDEDRAVADPICDDTMNLWENTARTNREIFTEIFRPVPTNLIRSFKDYDSYVPKVMTGHVVPDIPLDRIKDRLSHVRGALVECPMDFLIDQDDFVEGPDWKGLNPTLPIYI
ncbi:phospholipase D/nuclease [Trametes versicolor FP-101664 SS1]|uniref:phospholipase D/nuclease n=1 Tax=Trametes versicolor (strain FP-101664) TaxID=717944 RepID=UPI000462478A|nr:phospholipase D/nuclease [Trametes versicolor FP-101664 SS1]EIW52191.1 phospholipase D/nuclease [Trametes versicolor FP-101664 SS1]